MVDKFISAVKEKRTEALATFETLLVAAFDDGEKPNYNRIAATAIDQAISGTLDVVEEQYETLITATATDSEGEEVGVDMSCASDLSTLYMEEVNN